MAQVDVGSKTLGYLDAVLVDRGDSVRKGQVLALVRPSDLPEQLVEVRGVLAQVQAQRALARANAERASKLAPSGVVSQQELAQTQAALAAAEAAESSTRARLAALGIRLGETRILSPMDGVVSTRRLDPGALVGSAAGGSILTLVRVDRLRTFIAVSERMASRVSVGMEAVLELDALPGREVKGRVVRLAPSLDLATRTLEAEVHLENEDGLLRPGMYGRGSIVVEIHRGALTIPVAAVQVNREQHQLFVATGDRVSRRSIRIGVDGETWFEVLSGLAPSDQVVTAGLEGLTDGMVVRTRKNVDPFAVGKPAAEARPTPAERPSEPAGR